MRKEMKEPNWSTICLQLRRDYKGLSAIGKEVNSDWQHLNRLARGDVEQPKYLVGVKLLELHHDHCK